jgi:hypothetical protein
MYPRNEQPKTWRDHLWTVAGIVLALAAWTALTIVIARAITCK